MMKVHLKFSEEEPWHNISSLIRPFSVHLSMRLMNRSCESVVDTCSFTLKYDRLITAKVMSTPPGGRIQCLVIGSGEVPVFTGVIAPSLVVRKNRQVEDLTLEARDASWRLDLPLKEDFQIPSSILDEPAALRDIYEAVILDAGYEPEQIYPDGLGVDATIQMVSAPDGSMTYRQLLDSLLRDHGYVFSMTEDGRFRLFKWIQEHMESSGIVNQGISVVHPFDLQARERMQEGVRLTWSELEVLEDVRLFSANLPVGQDVASSGVTVLPGRYYPTDGDVIETFQNYRTEWMDEPYLSRKTRIRNRDITLVTSEAHRLSAVHDPGLVVEIEQYQRQRARILFHNPTPESQKLYVFEIYGRALVRSVKKETAVPAAAYDPEELASEYVFSQEPAEALATGLYHMSRFSHVEYRFTLREGLYSVGDVVTLKQNDPALDTDVLITELSWVDDRQEYRYQALGITEFADLDAVTTGYLSSKSGKGEQGEPGEDAYQLVILSTRGNLFRPQELETTLQVRVYQGGVNVTDQFGNEDFRWTRQSDNPASDEVWNSYHYSLGGKEIQVTTEDVYRRAVFSCTLLTKL